MQTLETFLATFSEPMKRAKARAALERVGRFNGELMPRYRYAARLAALPVLRFDESNGRLYTSESGTFFTVADLSRTLVDYALHLRGAGTEPVPYVEVDRETVVDHTTRLPFSVRVF